MRNLEFKFQPQAVKITPDEILADLNYPAPVKARRNGDRPAPRRRTRA
jgi:hypothetical protein